MEKVNTYFDSKTLACAQKFAEEHCELCPELTEKTKQEFLAGYIFGNMQMKQYVNYKQCVEYAHLCNDYFLAGIENCYATAKFDVIMGVTGASDTEYVVIPNEDGKHTYNDVIKKFGYYSKYAYVKLDI